MTIQEVCFDRNRTLNSVTPRCQTTRQFWTHTWLRDTLRLMLSIGTRTRSAGIATSWPTRMG
eukprot:3989920-Pyramimonas_sp.AAC.1